MEATESGTSSLRTLAERTAGTSAYPKVGWNL